MFLSTLLLLCVASATILSREYRERNKREIQHHYLQSLLMSDIHNERYIEQLALLSNHRTKVATAELLSELSPIIYRFDPEPFERIAQSLHLSDFLLEAAHRSHGATRAYTLSLFAQIPFSGHHIDQISQFSHSKNRMTRLFALMATINADRKGILKHIASYPDEMTPFEIAQLVAALSQGSYSVAYQPMLASDNLNTLLLGVAIVHNFGIESAESELRELFASKRSFTLRREIIYTLASMQLPIATPAIAQFLKAIPQIERRRFLRHITTEGYSQSTIEYFTNNYDTPYFQALINSYKIKIGC
ncbi:MAG: hypothetical protein SNH73_07350 [Rikenellaceae bacterium]